MGYVSTWFVYVIQGSARGAKPGRYYVGATTSPAKRLRQHNKELVGGAKATKSGGPWEPRALYGPYETKSEAYQAEYALKHQKRGAGRTKWLTEDSPLCRGLGPGHPWVEDPTWAPTV